MKQLKNQIIQSHPIFFDPLNKKVDYATWTGYIEERPGVTVYDNGEVEFVFYAPKGKKVQVAGITGSMSREPIELKPEGNGYFSARVDNIPKGFHYLEWFVDDVMILNQQGMLCYGCFRANNFFELPEHDDDFYLMREVPHGDVRLEQYPSSVNGRMKSCYVYTPPSYGKDPNLVYPVLYLLHGVGENETSWIWNGKANFILDNLIAEGRCKEMILVFNSGYAFQEGEDPVFYPGDFDGQLVRDCIPFIESRFRVVKDRKGRAIAGLSLGSAQATLSAITNPDLFCSFGVFSGFANKEFQSIFRDKLHYDLVFLSAGEGERGLFDRFSVLGEELKGINIPSVIKQYPGFHEWSPWRNSLRDYACELFITLEEKDLTVPRDITKLTSEEQVETSGVDINVVPNHALEQHILFHDPVYKEVIYAFDDEGNPAGRYGDIPHGVTVLRDGLARFDYYAPKATTVEVQILGSNPVPMEKNENGHWIAEVDDIEGGFHYLEFIVNGTHTINPQASVGYGCFKAMNYFEMPEQDFTYHLLKNVPHGSIHLNYYHSTQTGRKKACYVYTPPGYDYDHRKYPVLYLLHGGGENETGWVWQGKINYIADNMIAEGLCKELIIVMTTGYSFREDGTSHPLLGSVQDEIIHDCIPFIDGQFRTINEKSGRAMAGLSMGGMQTQRTVMEYQDLFSAVGIFSGGMVIENEEVDYRALLHNKKRFVETFPYFFVGCGKQDGLYDMTKKNVTKLMEEYDIPMDFYDGPGYHDWTFWRHCAYKFLPHIF